MVKEYVAVPPTPYYYGVRAELFLRLASNETDSRVSLHWYSRYIEYSNLAGTMPLGIPNREARQ